VSTPDVSGVARQNTIELIIISDTVYTMEIYIYIYIYIYTVMAIYLMLFCVRCLCTSQILQNGATLVRSDTEETNC